jgi:anti-sigma factor RsiW
MNSDCAQARKELGVYVLGAIGTAERGQVDRHLAACPRCREELAGLAGLPGLLRRIPEEMAAQAWIDDTSDPPPGPPLDTLIRRMTRTRIRRRLTAAAAAAAVAVGAALGLQALHHPAGGAAAATRWTSTVTAASPATGAWIAVRYTNQAWGTEAEVQITGLPAGTRCQLWVTNTKGQGIAAGGWTIAASRQHPWYPASLPWPAACLRRFDVTADGHTLFTATAQAGQ